ncbi:MAG: BTAD domain-containing putative transcriptional regulator [Rubrivivax sp.]
MSAPPPAIRLLLADLPRVDGLGSPRPLALRDAALLAWLALEGPTPRERLLPLLWPGSDVTAARNSLRQRLFQLRRSLGVELVEGGATLALAPGVKHDLDDADGVLGELAPDLGPEFAQWLERQRGRRRGRLRESLAELADMAERAEDWADALAHAQELLALEPLSEAAHRRVMRLHYLAGDRTAALLAFDRCERVLKDEVGARPDGQTLALLQTIESAAVPAVRGGGPVPAAVLRPPRLAGRERERDALLGVAGTRTIAVLAGEAGQGKSRLLAEVCAALGADAACAVGARPGDAAVPYALLARLLRALRGREGVAGDAVRGDLAVVLPECGAPAAGQRDRVRLVGATVALVDEAAARGLRLLAVDDLQFAEAASVELLAAASGACACAWVLAMRPHELPPAAQAWVGVLDGAPGALRVDLAPLDLAATQALVASLALPEVDVASLHRRTGGNPMFMLESLKAALQQPGAAGAAAAGLRHWPRVEGVQRVILQRLARLSPWALKLVRCAAVAGPDLSAALVADVLGLAPLDQADAWAELEAAQVLREQGFAHDLIAEAARTLVPAAVARPLHAAVAEHLERHGGEPARVAAHWIAGGRPLQAVPHLRAAARRAQSVWRPDLGAALHEQAAALLLAAGDRHGAFDAWFDAAQLWSQHEQLGDNLRRALAALDELTADDGQRARAGLVRVAVLVEERQPEACFRLLQQTLAYAEKAGLADVETEALWDLTVLHWERRELAQAAQCAERGLARLAAVDLATARVDLHETGLKLHQALGVISHARGRLAEGDGQLEQAYALALGQGELVTGRSIADALAMSALDQGDTARALGWYRRVDEQTARAAQPPSSLALELVNRMSVLAISGDLGAALAAAGQAMDHVRQISFRYSVPAAARCHWLEGELGRPDLALKGLHALLARADLQPLERLLVDALRMRQGEEADTDELLERLAALPDLPVRGRLLCWAQPGCRADRVLPMLHVAATSTRDQGAFGLWASLETARAAALLRLDRAAEAAVVAQAVWQRLEQGVAPRDPFTRAAGTLCAALAPVWPELAQTVALRAQAWAQRAAATLPPVWREVYLERRALPSPVRRLLGQAQEG